MVLKYKRTYGCACSLHIANCHRGLYEDVAHDDDEDDGKKTMPKRIKRVI